jgi:membrane protease YdiL (CAAX protease family)
MEFLLFVAAMLWAWTAEFSAERAAEGLTTRFQLALFGPLLESIFLLFLLVIGLRVLDSIATRRSFFDQVLPLPRRRTSAREWGIGAALGWGVAVVAVLPMVLSGHLHGSLAWQTGSLGALLLTLGTVLVGTLAQEAIFRGYAFLRLIGAVGPTLAAVLMAVLYGLLLVRSNPPRSPLAALVDCTLIGLLLAMAWLRTHALWLGWGLNFARRAALAVLLGLPVAGRGEFGALADMTVTGPRWLTGGSFGPDAAWLTALVLLATMVVLFRTTRDFAWEYTHEQIVAAGYEVTIAPPAAHVAMEKAAAPPALVQILATTPQTRSVSELPPQA